MDRSAASLRRKRIHCPHCDEYISKSLFYQHKHLYFDETVQQWKKSRHLGDSGYFNPELATFEFTPDETDNSIEFAGR